MTTQALPTTKTVVVRAQRLTAEAFRPYGRIVGTSREGLTATHGAFAANVVHVRRVTSTVDYINRHLDHSQMFVPLAGKPLVLVVAPPDQPAIGFDPSSIVAFIADGTDGFILDAGTWHIEPQSLASDDCPLMNLQTFGYQAHTDKIAFADHDVHVVLEIDPTGI